jgi:paraquat-inducible protein A
VEHSDTPLALVVAALFMFAVANAAPLMRMSELGHVSSTTVAGSVIQMWARGSEPTAVLVAICAIVAPGAYLALMLVVLLALRGDAGPGWAGRLLRWAGMLQPWAMPEVMLLGTLVAYVKLAELADASAGIGMYAIGALAALIAALGASLDRASLWMRVRWER